MEYHDKVEALKLTSTILAAISPGRHNSDVIELFDEIYSRTLKIISKEDKYSSELMVRQDD